MTTAPLPAPGATLEARLEAVRLAALDLLEKTLRALATEFDKLESPDQAHPGLLKEARLTATSVLRTLSALGTPALRAGSPASGTAPVPGGSPPSSPPPPTAQKKPPRPLRLAAADDPGPVHRPTAPAQEVQDFLEPFALDKLRPPRTRDRPASHLLIAAGASHPARAP